MVQPEENNKSWKTDPRETGISKLSEKQFIIIIQKKFNELQEHRKITEVRTMMYKQNENINRDHRKYKVNQIEILKLKNSIIKH